MTEPTTEASTPAAIELRHLRYFLAVVEQMHFGHAAEQLHISQPPVSRAIRQLEDELDVQLLERGQGGVSTTDAGTVFAEQAREIVARMDLAIAEARRAGGVASPLRVGSLDILPLERVQRFLNSLRQEPALEVAISHVPSREQVKRLRERALDLGIFTYARITRRSRRIHCSPARRSRPSSGGTIISPRGGFSGLTTFAAKRSSLVPAP